MKEKNDMKDSPFEKRLNDPAWDKLIAHNVMSRVKNDRKIFYLKTASSLLAAAVLFSFVLFGMESFGIQIIDSENELVIEFLQDIYLTDNGTFF